MATKKDLLAYLEQLTKDLQEVIDDVPKIIEDVAKESVTQIYEDLDRIFVTCIDKFYADYKPKFYRREGSLYKTYKITKTNTSISWDFGSQYMPLAYEHSHRVSNQYIYDQMFLQGYHGGAHTIDEAKVGQWGEHPEEGTPWYRTTHPIFTPEDVPPYSKWSRYKAKQSVAPAKHISEELQLYKDKKSLILDRGLNDVMLSSWSLVKGRYNLFNNY